MSKCPICASSLKSDIEKMIVLGANNQHIRDWASERGLRLTIKAIITHKTNHFDYVEKVSQPSLESESFGFTLSQIEESTNLSKDELLTYLAATNLKVHHRKKYDLIKVLKHFTKQLLERIKALEHKLNQLAPSSQKLAMAKLKQEKLEAQTRLLKAVARTKEIELAVALSKLIKNKELEERWSYSLVGFKAKLESMPNKLALELSAIDQSSNVRKVLCKLIEEALEELDNGR